MQTVTIVGKYGFTYERKDRFLTVRMASLIIQHKIRELLSLEEQKNNDAIICVECDVIFHTEYDYLIHHNEMHNSKSHELRKKVGDHYN